MAFELAVALALVTTVLGVHFQDRLINKTMRITPADRSVFVEAIYLDTEKGGKSSSVKDSRNPMAWTCVVREGFAYPYCNYEISFDHRQAGRGLDFSGLSKVRVDLSYTGPSDVVRFTLKNFDPRYSKLGNRDSHKHVKTDLIVSQGRQSIEVDVEEFTVTEWWVVDNKIPPELSKPQFENIVGIEFGAISKGTETPHHFRINAVEITTARISQSEFYFAMLAMWGVLVLGFLVHRAHRFRTNLRRHRILEEREKHALIMAKTAAESANAAKSTFLANMSHELRTPLNAVLGYAALIEEGRVSGERQTRAARTIRESGAHLLGLINDILDASKMGAGKLELRPAPFDLHQCLRNLREMIAVRAEAKDVAFLCAFAEDLPQYVIGDEKRLRQILINLLANAVKFTTRGEVVFEVTCSEKESGQLKFSVRDTGPGIPSNRLEDIFVAFEQLDNAGIAERGTGLGLSISKQLATLMSGTVGVQSVVGQGSIFWLEVGLEPCDSQAALQGGREVVSVRPTKKLPATVEAELAEPRPAEKPQANVILRVPCDKEMRLLLDLAKRGDMRAISAEAERIAALGEEYGPFTRKLRSLAEAYQSPAVLRLVEDCAKGDAPAG